MTPPIDELDIAIIGMAGRFPGARDVQEFWRNIRDGAESVRPLSREELERSGAGPLLDDQAYVPVASTLDGAGLFDAEFFGISPREAGLMDPQGRVFLECAWEALESAGYNPQQTGLCVGVFAAQSLSTYLLQNLHPELTFREFVLAGGNLNAILGNGGDFLATRVSYKLNLSGPSVNVQSACSSSLVAVHLARQALLGGECDMALAGGVSIYLPQEAGYRFQDGMILSPDGRCRPFDAGARGTVFGRGAGIVVMKPLSAAVRDGDPICAVVKGSAVNNDGATKVGFTAPGYDGQAGVVAQALANAGVGADTISYVEAHGTGTLQGDPIEVSALTRAFRQTTSRTQFCALGSLKGNVGHLDVAAGIAGLIKTVLMLQHRTRPPSLNYTLANPQIDFAASPFYVNAKCDGWPSAGAPRRAGVSSFGMGGTNAHVVLEEAAAFERPAAAVERPVHILPLSARTPEALRQVAARYASHLGETDARVADVCHTAAAGRAHWKHRAAVVGDSGEALRERLGCLARDAEALQPPEPGGGAGRIAFLFSGQGAQYPGMARRLYETHPVFRAAIDRCAGILAGRLPRPLIEVLYPPNPEDRAIDETGFTQPALFAVEYALAELWRSWGIEPGAVLGHSIGEYVAACVAGVFDLEEALRLVARRAQLMHTAPGSGQMVAAFASESVVGDVIHGLQGRVSLAAINGPAQVVVSGESSSIAAVVQRFEDAAIRWQRLAVSHGFHSPCMDPVLEEFGRALREVRFRNPGVDLISNVTGRVARAGELAAPGYWQRQVREPVRFADGIETLLGLGYRWFLEIGPHPVLTPAARSVADQRPAQWLPSLRRGKDDWWPMLESLSAIYAGGGAVNWAAFDAPYARRRVALPTYPFDRKRHWVEPSCRAEPAAAARELPGRRIKSPAMAASVFEVEASTEQAYLGGHRLFGMAVLPATGYLAAAVAAARATGLFDWPLAVEAIEFSKALVVLDGAHPLLQSVLSKKDSESSRFQFFSEQAAGGDKEEWVLHASGTVRRAQAVPRTPVDLAALRRRCCNPVSLAAHYDGLAGRGLQLGPAFRALTGLFAGGNEALGHVRADVGAETVHPGFLDATLQPLIQAAGSGDGEPGILVPVSIDRLLVMGTIPGAVWSHARVSACGPGCYSADINLYDEDGLPVAGFEGLRVRRVQEETLKRGIQRDPASDWLYEVEWQPSGVPYSPEQSAAVLLPAPGELAQRISPAFEPLGEAEGLPRYRQMLAETDRLCAAYARRALRDLGWRPESGERLATLPRHARLLGRLIEVVRQDWNAVADAAPDTLAAALMGRYPESRTQLSLIARCGERLAGVMRGEADPLQLLFPDGSLSSLEELYGNSAFARVYNRLAGELIAAACEGMPEGRRIRVLEVGAGTGGTTRYILPKLQPPGVEYTFSDVGSLFLLKAREKFSQYPNVRYEILDVERDPQTQGFGPHQFDIVVASNVLHATADLRRTVGYMRDLLCSQGLLVFVEGTGPARWVDLTFGLTEGWWKFTDTGLRPAHALLSAARWKELLGELGFSETATFPDVERGAGDGWQIIGVARGPALDGRESAGTTGGRPDCWIVVRDQGGFWSQLLRQFALRGEAAQVVGPDTLEGLAPALAGKRRVRGIVHLACLDAAIPALAEGGLESAGAAAARSLLSLVQTIAAARPSDPPRLWIVTRGVHDVAGSLDPSSLPQALAWGFGRTLAMEHPELRNVRIDLDPGDPDSASKLCQEILRGDREDQIAIRGAERRVARLVRRSAAAHPDLVEERGMRGLAIGERGMLDNLRLAAASRRPPGPSEVEIRVRATGLNFRDVLNALGLYPGPAPPFGGECSGTVLRVGEDVRGIGVGDEVLGVAHGSFAPWATTRQELVALKPAWLGFEDAASLPVAFLTAGYALQTRAALKAGERVLIHAAAGGVGSAAVQLARRAGAEVFATAGTEEKRGWLRRAGVQHVFDSRSTSFAQAVLDCTAGAGVDVVLNSLSGDFIPASLSVLARGGRFIELGKSGVWEPAQVAAHRSDVDYHLVDLAAECEANPAWVARNLPAIVAEAASGRLRPLPVTTFPLERAVDAFRFMAQARHIGKVVLTQQPAIGNGFRPDGTYLITGGCGALGLAAARWMTERGARRFVLMGRSPASAGALAQIRDMERLGASVEVVRGDVSRPDDVQAAVAGIGRGPAPLRGVIHAAGTLDDGVVLQQTWERFERVLGSKVTGAWNLHRATAGAPLDFFVMFSSVASLLGSAGQSNHAAANAFLDALAFVRRHNGLPALSINWGPWSQIGAAAGAPGVLDRVRLQGMDGIPPESGLRVFDALLRSNAVQAGVVALDWDRFLAPFGDRVSPYFSAVAGAPDKAARQDGGRAPASEPTALSRIQAAPARERRGLLAAHIRDQVRRALGFDAQYGIDDRQPLNTIGLDSLMAVELRNKLGATLAMKRSLPATLVFDYPTVDALAGYLLEVLGLNPVEAEVPAGDDSRGALAEEIGRLSDDEAERLLLQELDAANQKGRPD